MALITTEFSSVAKDNAASTPNSTSHVVSPYVLVPGTLDKHVFITHTDSILVDLSQSLAMSPDGYLANPDNPSSSLQLFVRDLIKMGDIRVSPLPENSRPSVGVELHDSVIVNSPWKIALAQDKEGHMAAYSSTGTSSTQIWNKQDQQITTTSLGKQIRINTPKLHIIFPADQSKLPYARVVMGFPIDQNQPMRIFIAGTEISAEPEKSGDSFVIKDLNFKDLQAELKRNPEAPIIAQAKSLRGSKVQHSFPSGVDLEKTQTASQTSIDILKERFEISFFLHGAELDEDNFISIPKDAARNAGILEEVENQIRHGASCNAYDPNAPDAKTVATILESQGMVPPFMNIMARQADDGSIRFSAGDDLAITMSKPVPLEGTNQYEASITAIFSNNTRNSPMSERSWTSCTRQGFSVKFCAVLTPGKDGVTVDFDQNCDWGLIPGVLPAGAVPPFVIQAIPQENTQGYIGFLYSDDDKFPLELNTPETTQAPETPATLKASAPSTLSLIAIPYTLIKEGPTLISYIREAYERFQKNYSKDFSSDFAKAKNNPPESASTHHIDDTPSFTISPHLLKN